MERHAVHAACIQRGLERIATDAASGELPVAIGLALARTRRFFHRRPPELRSDSRWRLRWCYLVLLSDHLGWLPIPKIAFADHRAGLGFSRRLEDTMIVFNSISVVTATSSVFMALKELIWSARNLGTSERPTWEVLAGRAPEFSPGAVAPDHVDR